MKTARHVALVGLLACGNAMADTPVQPMTPRQMDAALAALSGEALALASPRMKAFLSRAFPRGGDETCDGSFDGRDTQNNCQWFGVIEGDDPSPWPRFMLFFEDNQLVSVMTSQARALRASRHWRCQRLRDQRHMDVVECVRADLPAKRAATLRMAHGQMINSAD